MRRSSSTPSWAGSVTGRCETGRSTPANSVDLDGYKDILGMWAGDGDGESAKFWLAVLTEVKKGVTDNLPVVCDG